MHARGFVAGAAAVALTVVGLPAVAGQATGVPTCTHAWPGGDGTAGNPYHVASVADLQAVDTCLDRAFVQTADISLAGIEWAG